MLAFPNAKINIGLHVTARREDGFHSIESIFYPVNFADALEIVPADSFAFSAEGIIPTDRPEDNLCVKAYKLLQQELGLPPVAMYLLKKIPTGAGLGGGSSDASFTLKLLNELFELELSQDALETCAASLGSDCPFFIRNKPAYVSGRGESIEDIGIDLSGYHITIVHPGIHISTKDAFANIRPQATAFDLRQLASLPMDQWKGVVKNDFEPYAFRTYPLLQEIKDTLYRAGAIYTSMSGSGSAIYAISTEKLDISRYRERFSCWQGLL